MNNQLISGQNITAQEIMDVYSQMSEQARGTIEKAIYIGELLYHKKQELKHGEFIPWVEQELPFGRHQAKKYIQLYQKQDQLNGACSSHLGINATLAQIRQIEKEEKKQQRQAEIETVKEKMQQESQEITDKFDVIAIDPPWPYDREYDPETSRVANPYPEMPIEDIAAINLPIKSDAVVFLWATHAFLKQAFYLLECWGLRYRATLVWDKEKMGMGATVRMQCEFCLLATKGKPIIQGSSERDLLRESRREHSRKPNAFYEMVERMTIGSKLDYFSREQRDGWSSWGAENGKF